MRVFVTGVAGQLGFDVVCELAKKGYEYIGSDLAALENLPVKEPFSKEDNYFALDITDGEAVEQVIKNVQPDAVVHCAAWTAVDAAEEEENKEKVMKVNADGTENIARVCKELNCKMLYLSTDYVFDGQGDKPWEPDCKEYHPLNLYGESKLAGERAVTKYLEKFFIVRIAWVFGKNGKNFIKTMLQLAKKFSEIRVVSDQIGTPTYTYDLARLLVDMIKTEKYGFYHATNEGGFISWYDFTKEIFRQAALLGDTDCSEEATNVLPVTTEEYGVSKAKRPFNSRLDKSKLMEQGFEPLPDWKDALGRYLKEVIYKNQEDMINGTD